MTPKIKQLAKRQLKDYRNKKPGTLFSDPTLNLTIEQAYALQDSVTKLRVTEGEKITGYKVGCVGPGTTKQFGMKGPIRGTLFLNEVHKSGSKLNKSAFCNLAIEGEMAFKINNKCEVDIIFPVIELHNFIFRAHQKTLTELISNNGINAGIVLPSIDQKLTEPQFHDGSILSILINNIKIGSSALWPNQGDPKTTLDWVKGHLLKYGLFLQPEQIILAGTTLGLYPVQSGDDIKVLVDDQIKVQCTII
ncbi:MAG: hypothetical protein CML40_03450 [Rhodobacteraceae bacterium]|nr:MAG: hypothetical protein CML40_03450 [Paracoccaceae bacterium]